MIVVFMCLVRIKMQHLLDLETLLWDQVGETFDLDAIGQPRNKRDPISKDDLSPNRIITESVDF
jgi:hypothetical protein